MGAIWKIGGGHGGVFHAEVAGGTTIDRFEFRQVELLVFDLEGLCGALGVVVACGFDEQTFVRPLDVAPLATEVFSIGRRRQQREGLDRTDQQYALHQSNLLIVHALSIPLVSGPLRIVRILMHGPVALRPIEFPVGTAVDGGEIGQNDKSHQETGEQGNRPHSRRIGFLDDADGPDGK